MSIKGSSLFVVMSKRERKLVKALIEFFGLDQNDAREVQRVYNYVRETLL